MTIAAPDGQRWAEAPEGFRWVSTGRINSKVHFAPTDDNIAACGVGVDWNGGSEETLVPSPHLCPKCLQAYNEETTREELPEEGA